MENRLEKLVDIQNEIPKKLLGQLNLKQDSKSRPNLVLNPEAYEFYLRAKHSYDKIEKTDDISIIRLSYIKRSNWMMIF